MFLICLALAVLAGVVIATGLASWTFNKSINGSLVQTNSTVTITANGVAVANPTVLPGQAGVLTTRTSGTAGSATLGSGHGIITGQRVDIYWTGGQCYGAIVGTVSGLVVPIASVSGGTALPAATTAIVVSPTVLAPFEVIGDNVVGIGATCGGTPGYVVFATAGADVYANFLQVGGDYAWRLADGAVPWGAGVTITKAYFSQAAASGANASGMQAAALTN